MELPSRAVLQDEAPRGAAAVPAVHERLGRGAPPEQQQQRHGHVLDPKRLRITTVIHVAAIIK